MVSWSCRVYGEEGGVRSVFMLVGILIFMFQQYIFYLLIIILFFSFFFLLQIIQVIKSTNTACLTDPFLYQCHIASG